MNITLQSQLRHAPRNPRARHAESPAALGIIAIMIALAAIMIAIAK